MKLILAIISTDDSLKVSKALTKEGFGVTKMASTGGFLMSGNTTFLIGAKDEKVQQIVDIISAHSQKRTKLIQPAASYGLGIYNSFPMEVSVGGATIFVMDVEQFLKV